MSYRFLLAKSCNTPDDPPTWATLLGHTMQAVTCGNAMAERWSTDYLRAFGLPVAWESDLREAVTAALAIHDLGKANQQFQRLVRHQHKGLRQAMRHEVIGLYWILQNESFQVWLLPYEEMRMRNAVLCSLAGHHTKYDGFNLISEGSGDRFIHVFAGHKDIKRVLSDTLGLLARPDPPLMRSFRIDLLDEQPEVLLEWMHQVQCWWESALPEERCFVALVRSLVIAADLAASAIPRKGLDPVSWVEGSLPQVCSRSQLYQVATARLGKASLRPFQKKAAATRQRVTLITAGCGSGKTSAAYLWAANHGHGRKVFVCYPTTGTATEGFAGYIIPHDEVEATLVHSRAQLDLVSLSKTPEDDQDEQTRVEALAAWDVALIVCTADTVLGLLQLQKRGLFAFPSIASGAFIFDEIHSYDERMFRTLLGFLETLQGVPVLLMSASLPQYRLRALRDCLERIGEGLCCVEGPSELERIPRYRVLNAQGIPVWDYVSDTINAGGKVLWVSNTVSRCIARAEEALGRGFTTMVYHSRYRYGDRLERHREVISAFDGNGPAFALTTQVCEISLDISADLLVTDLAPVPALIQRLGRLNRRVTPDNPGKPGYCLILEPEQSTPYDWNDLESARVWLDCIGNVPVSQRDLLTTFVSHKTETPEGFTRLVPAWLKVPIARPTPLRQAGYTIPVIRKEDWTLNLHAEDIIRLTIPMPVGPVSHEVARWPRTGAARIAPEGRVHYDERWGATWVDET